jgi:hypothetical protein
MASGNTLLIFTALHNEPPATLPATLDFRNGQPVLDYDAAATETAIFSGIMPAHYSATTGVTVRLIWMASTATSANAVLETAFERCNTDADADSFATANQATGTANATSGISTTTTIAHTNGAQMDSLAVGERFRLRVQRIGASGSDTMAGDLELVAVELQET